ncbi:DUF2933 domain-containing protein [Candidatus Woesearchaeota archaeon]|nr:DUF2933 domain-containing protein [Candidatus Woesearchaeota archaeon]
MNCHLQNNKKGLIFLVLVFIIVLIFFNFVQTSNSFIYFILLLACVLIHIFMMHGTKKKEKCH